MYTVLCSCPGLDVDSRDVTQPSGEEKLERSLQSRKHLLQGCLCMWQIVAMTTSPREMVITCNNNAAAARLKVRPLACHTGTLYSAHVAMHAQSTNV